MISNPELEMTYGSQPKSRKRKRLKILCCFMSGKSQRCGSAGIERGCVHACMPVYLGISCVKEGGGETRGGGRADKEVESSTTLAGVTLEEPEQMLLGRNTREGSAWWSAKFQVWSFESTGKRKPRPTKRAKTVKQFQTTFAAFWPMAVLSLFLYIYI